MTTPDHIVLVSLENEDFSTIVGNTADAPFLNQLISEGMLFTNYHGLTHPSQANYIALFSGSTQGVTNNGAIPQFPASVPTLASALAAKGLTFGGYAETTSNPEREPWTHFANSAADARNMSAFPQTAAGFANLPTVSFISPNDADNMTPTSDNGGGVPAGDAWVQANLGAYAAWAQANNSLLIITFDENNTNPAVTYPDQIATIVVGAGVPAGVTNGSQADTYSLLNTIQSLYGLTPVGVSAGAPALDFYSATPLTATSTVTTSFSGISDPNNYPPENALAVGPQSILTAESVPYEVTDLTGGAATTKSQFQLFSSLGTTLDNSVFDTRAAYDSSTGRFVMIANNLQPGGTSTNIDIAVSRDSNPADGWYIGSIDTSQGGTVQSDMPYLSVSNGNLYITAPEYSNGPFVGTGEWVVSENSVISGSTQVAASNTTPASDAIMRGVAGANGQTYYLGTYSDGRETALTYQAYDPTNGFSATQTLYLGTSDVGGGGNDYTAAQLGTSLTLDAGDSRIQSLAYASSGGRNYIYGVSEVMPSAGSLAQIEWFKLDVTDPANPQYVNGNVITGASIGANVTVFNPSIAVDGRGDLLINFTASGPNMDPSDYYVVWGAGDANFNAPTLYQGSTSYFQQAAGSTGAQRWGTYSSAIADPASQGGFWISNEYVTNTGVTIPTGLSAWWDTVVTRVQVAPYAPIVGGAGSTVTYTQGGAATPLDSALTVQDLGSATLAGATVAISSGLLTGDSLNFSNQNGITGTFNATTGVLTLSGTASLAAYQTALASITYSSTSSDASNAGADPSRTITWTVTDGAQSSTPVTGNVDIGAGSTVTTSFSGISDPTNYPPQNALAIGPQYIVTAETTKYEMNSLNGGGASTGSLYTLFSSLGSTLDNSIYDPRAAYDGSTGRYVLIANNIQSGGATNIDVAVSQDSNPNDGWYVGSVSLPAGNQSDMPYLSINGNDGNIYISAPEYPSSGYTGTGEWVVSESSVVNGSPQVIASNTAPPGNGIMRNVAGGNGYTYYLGSYSNGSQTELTYQTYSASAGFSPSQTLALGNSDQGPGGSDYTASQAGTSLTLDAGDGHIQSLAYANGYVYGLSETMPVGASAPEIHWFKLNVSNPASPKLAAQGDLSGALLGSPNIALFNPSIAVDGNGDVLINFTASGPNMDPSDYYVVQGARDLAFSAPTLYQGSTSYFQQTVGSTGAQRWGANSSAVADPNNPSGFWISNEYVTNAGVTIPIGLSAWWDTAVAQISVGAPVSSGPPVVSVATFEAEQSSLDATPGGFSISDTAADVAGGLNTLSPDSHITSITVTDNNALTVSVAEITSDAAALAIVANANGSPYTLGVVDSPANVAANLDALNADTHVASIALTGAGTQTLTLTSAQAANDARALGEITTPYTIVIPNVSGTAAAISAALGSYEASLPVSITVTDNNALTVSVAEITSDAAALAIVANANGSPYTLGVVDSPANVAANLDALNADTHVASIALTGAGTQTLTLTSAQAANDARALGEITTPYTIVIPNVSGTAAAISAALGSYEASLPVSITVTDNNALTVSVAEITSDAAALAIVANANGSPYTLGVVDSPANVAANLDALNADTHVASIALTGAGTQTLTLTSAQAANDARALGEITTPYTIVIPNVSGTAAAISAALGSYEASLPVSITVTDNNALTVSVAEITSDAAALAIVANANGSPYTLGVVDSPANVAANLDALNADTHVASIALTGAGTQTLTLTSAQAANDARALGEITTPYTIVIPNVSGTAAAISAALGSYEASLPVSITVTDNNALTVSVAEITSDAAALAIVANANGSPYTLGVVDSPANVAANLDALNADTHVASIALTGAGTQTLTLTSAQAANDARALGEITTPYTIVIPNVSGTAAAISAALGSYEASLPVSITVTDNNALTVSVAEITSDAAALAIVANANGSPYTLGVVDSPANVAANLDALNADTHVASIALTGAGTQTLTLTSAQAANDARALGEITTPYTIVIPNVSGTAAAISAALGSYEASLPVSITVTDNNALTVSVAEITSDAAALAIVANANGSPYTLGVVDSPANVAANLDALNADTHVASIALTGAGTQTLTLTSAQAANDARALGEITTPYTIVIPNVSGTAAAISAALGSYEASLPVSITVTDNNALTVSVAEITSDAAALAIVANANGSPYTLGVVDSPANVAANLDALNADTHVASIALTGAGTQTFAISLQQALNDTKALAEITTPHTVQIVDTAANIASITSTQAAALKSAGVTSLVSTTGAVSITTAEALFLLGDGISITGGALTATGAAATVLALTTAQAASLSAGGYALVVVDTAASIHALSATQIGSLGSLRVARISASDTSVALTVAQVKALETANIPVSAPTGSKVSVTDISPSLAGMSAIVIAGLPALGATAIVSSNGTVSMNLAQVIALENVGLRVVNTSGSATVRATDTALAIQSLTLLQISGLPGAGVTSLLASDTSVVLTLGQAAQLEAVKLKIAVPTGASVSASDTAANVGAFTATEIAALPGTGVTAINVTDANNVIFNVAQVQALEKAKTALSVQSGQHAIIQDTAADIATLTAGQMAGLSALHITQIETTDTVAKLTVAQANALLAENISVSAYQGASVELYDTSANLLALSVATINALPGIGVTVLASSNSAPKFSVAQATAFENDRLTVAPYSGAAAIVSDTGANLAMLTPGQIGSLVPTGFGRLVSTSGGVGLTVIQAQALEIASLKVTAASGSKVTISDLAANIASMSALQLAGLSKIGVSSIAATGAGVPFNSLAQALALESPVIKVSVPSGFAVTASDTAATIQTLSTTQIAGLKSIGLTGLASNNVGVTLAIAEATALESAGVSLTPPIGSADSILDTAAHIQALTAVQIAGLVGLGVTQIAASDTGVGLKTAQAVAIESAGIHVSGPGATTVSDTAANLQALTATQISALPGIGVTGLYSNNANVAYSAAQTSAIVSANLTPSAISTHTVAETFSNGVTVTTAATGSGGSLTLSSTGSGSTVSVGPSTLDATSGGQTIPLTSHATEAITTTGNTGDTFVFGQGFGADTLFGFAATGTAPDLLEFEASMFSYLTPSSMTQTQEALAVLGNATSSGGNITIADSFGDALTLHATSLATLKANPGDFKFV